VLLGARPHRPTLESGLQVRLLYAIPDPTGHCARAVKGTRWIRTPLT